MIVSISYFIVTKNIIVFDSWGVLPFMGYTGNCAAVKGMESISSSFVSTGM